MVENKNSYSAVYKYDDDADILGVKAVRDFKYNRTVEMDNSLFLDFDADNIPEALEIHYVSERLNVSKESLKNISSLKISISVNADLIIINAVFGLMIQESVKEFLFNHVSDNFSDIADIEAELVI